MTTKDKLNELLKSNSLEQSLMILSKELRDCHFSRLLKTLDLKEIEERLQTNNIRIISAFFRGKTHQCIICGKTCLQENVTCSRKCQAQYANKVRELNNLKKYGVKNVFQLESVKEKSKQTMLEKYGVEYSSQRDEWKQMCFKHNTNKVKIKESQGLDEIKKLDQNILYKNNIILNIISSSENDSKANLKLTLKVQEQGKQVLHIFSSENPKAWLSLINSKLRLNKVIDANDCELKELCSDDVKLFLKENNIQRNFKTKINLGLFYNGSLIQVMCFGKSRYNHNFEYELIRTCPKNGFYIKDGALKLFNYFIEKFNPKSICAYANLRYQTGKTYEKLGFNFIRLTEPNYFYIDSSGILHSRLKFQKHKLKSFKNYSDDKTELQIMQENGYQRVYDCGHLLFGLNF